MYISFLTTEIKKLMDSMMEKEIPGFCSQVTILVKKFGFSSISDMVKVKNIRREIKKRIINIQRKILFNNFI